ncbi:MAG: DUF4252 domain-containing protein [Saprospiraceae bacterium]
MRIFLLLLLTVFTLSLSAQSRSLERFVDHYRGLETADHLNLGGFIIKAIGVFSGDADAREVTRRLSHLRVLTIDNGPRLLSPEITGLTEELRRDKFEDFIEFREGKEGGRILIRENKRGITDLVLLLNGDENEFILVSLEGLFSFKDLQELDIDFNGKDYLSGK